MIKSEKKKQKKPKLYKEKQILEFIGKGKKGKYYVASNIYILIQGVGKAIWKVRFQFQNKRFERKWAVYGENNPYFKGYEDAISKSVMIQKALASNKNPLLQDHCQIQTLDDLFSS